MLQTALGALVSNKTARAALLSEIVSNFHLTVGSSAFFQARLLWYLALNHKDHSLEEDVRPRKTGSGFALNHKNKGLDEDVRRKLDPARFNENVAVQEIVDQVAAVLGEED